MRRRIWMAVALAVAAVAVGAWVATRSVRRETARFETARVDRGRIVARITATGTLSALVTVQVGAQVSGRIQELYADFNSSVTKGQLLAKIDPQLFQATVEQARANHLAAQGNSVKSKVQALEADRQFARAKALFERKLIAQADRDTAEANAEAARAAAEASRGGVEQTRAALHQAEVNLAYTSILSPITGTVISRNVDVGQTVASALQAPTLFTIAEDLRKMEIHTNIAEGDVGKLKPDLAVTFNVDAYPAEKFVGVIRQIRNAPQIMQNVVTYDAVVAVDNPDLKLKPGMTANVTVTYGERSEALRVPNAALRFRPSSDLLNRSDAGMRPPGSAPSGRRRDAPSNQRTVWTLRDNQLTPAVIRTGLSDGSVSEVTEGELKEGDLVVTDASGEGGAGARPGGGAGPFPPFGRFP